jgi:hypothetical protein
MVPFTETRKIKSYSGLLKKTTGTFKCVSQISRTGNIIPKVICQEANQIR